MVDAVVYTDILQISTRFYKTFALIGKSCKIYGPYAHIDTNFPSTDPLLLTGCGRLRLIPGCPATGGRERFLPGYSWDARLSRFRTLRSLEDLSQFPLIFLENFHHHMIFGTMMWLRYGPRCGCKHCVIQTQSGTDGPEPAAIPQRRHVPLHLQFQWQPVQITV